ncbi:MAG: glycosyltransferase family 39 protein [Eubacteriales bacterium]
MITSFILLYYGQDRECGCATAVVRTLVVWQFILLCMVQGLSAITQLHWTGLFVCYATVDLALLLYHRKQKVKCWNPLRNVKEWIDPYVVLLFLTWLIAFVIAVIHIPYNWDSMTYHLPRIAHWVQNESVQHFASNDDRLIASPVLAAYTNLCSFLWFGQEVRVLNLLQCFAYGVNAYLVYGIAVIIGAKKKYAYVATLLFLTMPIAFAEATTTQVDHYSTMWLLCFAYLLIPFWQTEQIRMNKKTIKEIVYLALCASFAYLAKPSVGFAIVILLIGLLVSCIQRKDDIITLIKLAVVAGVAILVPILPEWIRNLASYGSISVEQVGSRQLVGTILPHYLFINWLKNITFNLAPIFPEAIQYKIEDGLESLANGIGVDFNHESIAEGGMNFSYHTFRTYNCDVAVNVVVAILALICCIILCIRFQKLTKIQRYYSITAMVSFGVFCVALRWESFVTRYMLSYLALLCPMIVIVIQQCIASRREVVHRSIIGILVVVSGLFFADQVVYSYEDGPTYEISGYFTMGQPYLLGEYIELEEYVSQMGYETYGILMKDGMYEYPLWRAIDNQESEIRHIMVESTLSQYEDASYIPDCIIITKKGVMESTITYNGTEYVKNEVVCEQFVTLYEQVMK